jgi:hypothetical protein
VAVGVCCVHAVLRHLAAFAARGHGAPTPPPHHGCGRPRLELD